MPRRVVHRDIYGKLDGNFSPHQPMEDFLRSVRKLREANPQLETIFAPKCDFTTRIVKLGEEDEVWDAGFVRTKNPADGGIVEKPNQAIAIFNADCPVVSIFDEEKGRLAVLHAGFRCLIPEDKSRFSILETAFAKYGFNGERVKVFCGFGIGPCCYGGKHLGIGRWSGFLTGRVTRGPRSEQKSFDLYEQIFTELVVMDEVPPENMLIDKTCTACKINYGKHLYHSNVYEGKSAGSNAVLIWYEED